MSGNGRPSPVLRIIGTPRGQSYWAPGQVSAEEEDAQAAPDPRRRKYVRRRMQEQTGGESGHRGAREDAAAEGKGPRASVDVQLHEDDLVEAPRDRGEKEELDHQRVRPERRTADGGCDERREDDAEGDNGREDEEDPVPHARLQGPGEAVLPRAVREEGLRQGVRAVVEDLAQLEGDEEEGGGRRVEEIQDQGWTAQVGNRISEGREPIADGEARDVPEGMGLPVRILSGPRAGKEDEAGQHDGEQRDRVRGEEPDDSRGRDDEEQDDLEEPVGAKFGGRDLRLPRGDERSVHDEGPNGPDREGEAQADQRHACAGADGLHREDEQGQQDPDAARQEARDDDHASDEPPRVEGVGREPDEPRVESEDREGGPERGEGDQRTGDPDRLRGEEVRREDPEREPEAGDGDQADEHPEALAGHGVERGIRSAPRPLSEGHATFGGQRISPGGTGADKPQGHK